MYAPFISNHSLTTNKRKKRPAPPPPYSTSLQTQTTNVSNEEMSPIYGLKDSDNGNVTCMPQLKAQNTNDTIDTIPEMHFLDVLSRKLDSVTGEPSKAYIKDQSSIMRKSISSSSTSTTSALIPNDSNNDMNDTTSISTTKDTLLNENKPSSEYKCGKKKGPAPPRPVPPKRQIQEIPEKRVNKELHEIELKQIDLEKHETVLEEQIRDLMLKSFKNESESEIEVNNDIDNLDSEVEDAVIVRLDLVNDIVRLRIDLFRLRRFLIHFKRIQSLDGEHADLEHQIRASMAQPEALKSSEDKIYEDILINRLVTVVGQRNDIVDCLEKDRLRALEEDKSIEIFLDEFDAKQELTDSSEKVSKKDKGT